MQFMNLELARRVENAEGTACSECAEAFQKLHPEFPVAVERIGGGVAVFAGVESPVTQAMASESTARWKTTISIASAIFS